MFRNLLIVRWCKLSTSLIWGEHGFCFGLYVIFAYVQLHSSLFKLLHDDGCYSFDLFKALSYKNTAIHKYIIEFEIGACGGSEKSRETATNRLLCLDILVFLHGAYILLSFKCSMQITLDHHLWPEGEHGY